MSQEITDNSMSVTMIRVDTATRDELKKLGTKDESYDSIIQRLIQEYYKRDKRAR